MKCNNELLESYVRDTLQVPVRLVPWSGESKLPGYLKGQYRFFEATVADTRVLFCCCTEEPSPRLARKHEAALREQWQEPIAFAFDRVTPSNRQRLIREGVAFVVPANQLFLPSLGMSLRERYRTRISRAQRLRPSAQVLFLHALTGESCAGSTPSVFARRLGYTAMAMGQALDQLESAGLVSVRKVGRERLFELAGDPAGLWLSAQPVLSSPVRRRRFSTSDSVSPDVGLSAGLSALAVYSSLTDSRVPVRALGGPEAKQLLGDSEAAELSSADDADVEIEVWSYPPNVLSEGPSVDRLSLYLSLRDDPDERVQSTLDEMLRGVAWCEV